MASKMLSYLHSDNVLYECSCQRRKPIQGIYFCKHCLKLRCRECVAHEVDTHFCPNCMENLPSAEALLKRNKCANCFDCPSCFHTLSTRASNLQIPSSEDPNKMVPKKVYYLACGSCRWTSRDVDLKDQQIASGGWPEIENPYSKRVSDLVDYYRTVALTEVSDKEKKKLSRRRGYLYFSEKYGLTAALARKKAGLPPLGNLSLKDENIKNAELISAPATEEPEPLPETFLTEQLNIYEVCRISQRLSKPEIQPTLAKDMMPGHKHLQTKQSHRCKECDHNLSKPEYNPISIKFKIQLTALFHIPNLKFLTTPMFTSEQVSSLVLTLSNPSQHPCRFYLLPLEDKDKYDPLITADIQLPICEFTLAPHDDAAEFDEASDPKYSCKQDPSVIAFRKANKVGVLSKLTPRKGESEVHVAFQLKWDYIQNVHATVQPAGSPTEQQCVWMQTRIDVHLGPVNGR
ncbi:Dynactin subunit 4 [Chamberlinius hualienensis]